MPINEFGIWEHNTAGGWEVHFNLPAYLQTEDTYEPMRDKGWEVTFENEIKFSTPEEDVVHQWMRHLNRTYN